MCIHGVCDTIYTRFELFLNQVLSKHLLVDTDPCIVANRIIKLSKRQRNGYARSIRSLVLAETLLIVNC